MVTTVWPVNSDWGDSRARVRPVDHVSIVHSCLSAPIPASIPRHTLSTYCVPSRAAVNTPDHPVFPRWCAGSDRHRPVRQMVPGARIALRGKWRRGGGGGEKAHWGRNLKEVGSQLRGLEVVIVTADCE